MRFVNKALRTLLAINQQVQGIAVKPARKRRPVA